VLEDSTFNLEQYGHGRIISGASCVMNGGLRRELCTWAPGSKAAVITVVYTR